jgi:hypothetical protein
LFVFFKERFAHDELCLSITRTTFNIIIAMWIFTDKFTDRFRTITRLAALPVTTGLVTNNSTAWRRGLANIDTMRSSANGLTLTAGRVLTSRSWTFYGAFRLFTFDFASITHWLLTNCPARRRRTDRFTDGRAGWVAADPGALWVARWRTEHRRKDDFR